MTTNLRINDYKNHPCDFCSKSCIDKELHNVTKITYAFNNTSNKYDIITRTSLRLCSFCEQFYTQNNALTYQGVIATFAIDDKSIRLTGIEYDDTSDTYTLYFTYTDNDQAREGWVA